MKMTKGYQKLLEQEQAELIAVMKEFRKVEKAVLAYEKAMNRRIASAKLNGAMVDGHTVNCGNTHQSEIDRLRDASLVFGETVGGRGFKKALEIFHRLHEEVFEALEMETGTIL